MTHDHQAYRPAAGPSLLGGCPADGNLLSPPAGVGDQLTRIRKALSVLLKRGLVEEADVLDPAQAWRHEEDRQAR